MSSYFFLHADKNAENAFFIDSLQKYSQDNRELIYVLDRPLTDNKYSYSFERGLIILSPKHKIAIVNYGKNNEEEFEDFVEDIIEDLGSISDKFMYKNVLGRPRKWRKELLDYEIDVEKDNIDSFFSQLTLKSPQEEKKIDLIISLFIGSINDIDRVKEDVPITLLDKVKQKIQLFDGDQTRFIYQAPAKKKIIIQGLSGTGKTELLLHKLKDLYVVDEDSRIYFTCHNRILADNLKKRIPNFFNFMKVEQQIEWQKRLWCTNAWGSGSNPNSGAYRYICGYYNIPFYRFSFHMSFSKACKKAIDAIKEKYEGKDIPHALTYMFIDESQDFDEMFFELCELVTEKYVYVAGDVFQSIFDEYISDTIEPDFLLGKCYRTDPKTLMFAHALGMGLFEESKLRWLDEKEWRDCGYNVEIRNSNYLLSREPLRRFEDLSEDFESIKIVEADKSFSDSIVDIIKEIKEDNETVQPDDIGIILLDNRKSIYELADVLQIKLEGVFGWKVNKAYESKEKIPNTVLVSNRNNVKGLEFPFVICVTTKINDNPSYRNSLYTMISRSFIKTYFLTQDENRSGLTAGMKDGLKHIVENQVMVIQEPSEEEKERIKTKFEYKFKKMSHYDQMKEIFNELHIDEDLHDKLMKITQDFDMIDRDKTTLIEFIQDNLKYI